MDRFTSLEIPAKTSQKTDVIYAEAPGRDNACDIIAKEREREGVLVYASANVDLLNIGESCHLTNQPRGNNTRIQLRVIGRSVALISQEVVRRGRAPARIPGQPLRCPSAVIFF